MNTDLEATFQQYNDLVAAGKEEEANTFIAAEFEKLPQDLKDELLGEMLTIAIEDETEPQRAVADLSTEGIEILKKLDEIEKEKLSGELDK